MANYHPPFWKLVFFLLHKKKTPFQELSPSASVFSRGFRWSSVAWEVRATNLMKISRLKETKDAMLRRGRWDCILRDSTVDIWKRRDTFVLGTQSLQYPLQTYLGGGFKYFVSSPLKLGKMNPFWRLHLFSNGLKVQPPTRYIFRCKHLSHSQLVDSTNLMTRASFDVTPSVPGCGNC